MVVDYWVRLIVLVCLTTTFCAEVFAQDAAPQQRQPPAAIPELLGNYVEQGRVELPLAPNSHGFQLPYSPAPSDLAPANYPPPGSLESANAPAQLGPHPYPTTATAHDPAVGPPVGGFLNRVETPAQFANFQPPSIVTDAPPELMDAGRRADRFDVGTDLYSAPDFAEGLIIFGPDVAMKIGGFVKADFIYDFDPIDNTDAFETTSIPVGAAARTNSRFHARQTRLSFDTRWASDAQAIRILVEGDFFSEGDRYRLRHAYGEVGSLLVGQTWTTFTDVAAAPATLDFEGSVSNVNRRQAQARWTVPLGHEDLTLAMAVEDTRFILDVRDFVTTESRSPSPDFVGHLRWKRDWGQFQAAGLYRIVGGQVPGDDMRTKPAWGLNLTGVILLTGRTTVYNQLLFGEGIGSYRSLPDAAQSGPETLDLLPLVGWMVGATHEWTEGVSSNFTYAENVLDNTAFQSPDELHRATYLAANIIWQPLDRVRVGIELLNGLRENVDRATGQATRVQTAFIFDLP